MPFMVTEESKRMEPKYGVRPNGIKTPLTFMVEEGGGPEENMRIMNARLQGGLQSRIARHDSH